MGQRLIREKTELAIRRKKRAGYAEGRNMKKTLLAMSILLGLLGFSACGEASSRTVYQYRETEVFQNFYVKKAVYTPGELKLYYRGGAFKDNTVRCYGADFEDLGDAFAYTFQNGVLTIRADFAEQISGLMIDDPGQSVRYRLRYLDSSQFASLTDIFWYDDGWSETGDAEAYYSAEELQAEADRKAAIRQESLETFALLEGTWVCEDGLRKYEFTVNEDKSGMTCSQMWWNEGEQSWEEQYVFAKSAFQTKGFGALLVVGFDCDADCDYDEIAEKAKKLIAITLVNSDPAAADVCVLYDSEENIIRDTDTIYHKQ